MASRPGVPPGWPSDIRHAVDDVAEADGRLASSSVRPRARPRPGRPGGVGVSAIGRTLPFYTELLGPRGYHSVGQVEGERDPFGANSVSESFKEREVWAVRAEGGGADDDSKGAMTDTCLSAVAKIPVPSGFVRISTSSGRAPALVTICLGSIVPVTAMPNFGSSSLIVCPPIIATPA